MKKQKVGLVLSGGGVRGFCHLGVLKVLLENGIEPTVVSGTSMGALIGGMYASGTSISTMDSFSKKFSIFKVADINAFRIFKQGVIRGEKVCKLLRKMCVAQTFEDCKVKFISNAFDVTTGKMHAFQTGDLVDGMYASMAVPAIFKPFEKDGHKYVDGGVMDNMPFDEIKKCGCDVIVSVDAIGEYDGNQFPENAISMLVNIINIQTREIERLAGEKGDVHVVPKLDGITNFNFKKSNTIQAIAAGEAEMKKHLNVLLDIIKNKEKD